MSRQDRFTKAARGRDCQVRLPGCKNDTQTVVLAHYRLSGTCGVGIKPNNLQGAWCCSYCHDIADFRRRIGLSREEIRLYHAEGVFRTIDTLISEWVLKI